MATCFLKSQSFIARVKQELFIYSKLIPIVNYCQSQGILDDIISDYHHFMLHFNDISNLQHHAQIPDSIKLIWRIHLIHPYTYYNDCIRNCKRIIDPHHQIFTFTSFNIHDYKPLNTHPHNQVTPQKFTEIDLKHSLLNQANVFWKNIINDIDYFHDDLNIHRTIDEFIHFLQLVGAQETGAMPMIPSQKVDLIWHTLMLYPQMYQKESNNIANTFVIHDDFIPQSSMPQYVQNTQKEWTKMYGSKKTISYLSHTMTAMLVILCSVCIYIGYSAYLPSSRRRLAAADSATSIGIILGILAIIIIICVFVYYRSFRYLCHIEGCLVAVDQYQIYTHLSDSFPEGLKYSNTSTKTHVQNGNASSMLYSYTRSKYKGNVALSFDSSVSLNQKLWKIAFKKHDNIVVSVIYSIPYYNIAYSARYFESSMNLFCDTFIDQMRNNVFKEYDNDYDDTDDDDINEMPLYILSIRCKLIFVQLFTTFNRNYYWFRCKNTDEMKVSRENDRKVQKAIDEDHILDQRMYKLLFLGSGASGKSTIFRQLRQIYGRGFDEEFRLKFKQFIYNQVIADMKRCIERMNMDFMDTNIELTDEGVTASAELLNLLSTNTQMTPSVAKYIAVLWNEARIKSVYDLRSRTKIADSSGYFFDAMDRISQKDYIPTDKDIFLTNNPTIGIDERRYQLEDNQFLMVDVGGQRTERRKWLHCFDNVSAFIFVASLSCYDEVLDEDEFQNSMMEQIAVFEEMVNNHYLRYCQCILLLNKNDLFAEKIKSVPITVCPEFKGFEGDTQDYDQTSRYIADVFRSKHYDDERNIYIHIINAIDTDFIAKVFDDIKHSIIYASLAKCGLCGGFSGPSISLPKIKMPTFKKKLKEKQMLKTTVIPSASVPEAEEQKQRDLYEDALDFADDDIIMEIGRTEEEEEEESGFAGEQITGEEIKQKMQKRKRKQKVKMELEMKDAEIELPKVILPQVITDEFDEMITEEEEEEADILEDEHERKQKDEEEEVVIKEEELEKQQLDEIQQEIEFQQAMKKRDRVKDMMEKIKTKFAEWKAARKLIDNVFADLENMFYLLSQLLVMIELQSLSKPRSSNTDHDTQQTDYNTGEKCHILCANIFKICIIPLAYLLVFIVAIFVILPSCFFLLIVRMNKVETTTKYVRLREIQLAKESKCQRFMRVINQLLRSSFMLIFLVIYPVIITYLIIPLCNYNDSAVIWSISSYLFMILLLQMFGTWRGVKSFEERKKLKPNEERYKPQKFVFNLGSIIAILLLLYEVFQLSIFAYQTSIDSTQTEAADDQVTFSAESLPFVDSEKILQFTHFMVRICYLSLDFLEQNRLQYYLFFSLIFVGLLIMFFVFRFVYELRAYGTLKWKQNDAQQAREVYFHSFVGTIIYGHGRLKHVNKWNAKIIALLADSFFLGICQKIILILSCDEFQFLRIEPEIKCWQNEHQLYSCIALILLGFYIPICAMISPMFQEEIEFDQEEKQPIKDEEEETKGCCGKKKKKEQAVDESSSAFKQFVSFSNTIAYVAPYMSGSAFTVMECFMLISSEFVSKGSEYGAIVSQSIAMCGLLWFTISWSFADLNKYGLTQNEPVFPFGVSVIKIFAFVCGLIGCILEILRYNKVIDVVLELFILFVLIIVFAMVFVIIFLKYHRFFNPLDDDLDINILVKFNKVQKSLKIVDLAPDAEKSRPVLVN